MKNSNGFELFKKQKLIPACRAWATALRKNGFQSDLIRELEIARREIDQMTVAPEDRSLFVQNIDLISSWHKLDKKLEFEIKGLLNHEISPFSILFYEDYIYISDELNHCLLKFDVNKQTAQQIGNKGQAPGQFWYPAGLAIVAPASNNSSEIICCDSWNHRLQFFDLDGNLKRVTGRFGKEFDAFKGPYDLVLSEDGFLWVADRANHRIKKISLSGETLEVYGSAWDEKKSTDAIIDETDICVLQEEIPASFFYPGGIWANARQQLIISDRNFTCIMFHDGMISSYFGNTGPLMPRNLTGDGTRLLVKDEVTNDLFCLSNKGVPVCRLKKEKGLLAVSGSSDIMEIDGSRIILYRFKTAAPKMLWALIDLAADEASDNEMFSYSLTAGYEEESHGYQYLSNDLERISRKSSDNKIFSLLAKLWSKNKITFKGFSDYIINYLGNLEKEIFYLLEQFKRTHHHVSDKAIEIIDGRISGDPCTKEEVILLQLLEKRSKDATATLLEIRKALKIYIKTINVVQDTVPKAAVVEYTNCIIRLISIPSFTFYLPRRISEHELINEIKESAITIADMLWDIQEYSAFFLILESLLSVDPMNKPIHRRLETILK